MDWYEEKKREKNWQMRQDEDEERMNEGESYGYDDAESEYSNENTETEEEIQEREERERRELKEYSERQAANHARIKKQIDNDWDYYKNYIVSVFDKEDEYVRMKSRERDDKRTEKK